MSNKTLYVSPAAEEIELFVEAPIADSGYDENGGPISGSDTEYNW